MKKLAKVLSLALVLVMVLSLGGTAWADPTPVTTGSISISNTKTGHTYEAYQIFDGDLVNDNGSLVLSNIKWGTGVLADMSSFSWTPKDTELKTANAVADYLAGLSGEAASAAADALATHLKTNNYLSTEHVDATTPVEGKYTISGLYAGYYLVVDKAGVLPAAADDVYSDYIVQVLGTVTSIAPKGSIPSLDKQVADNETGNAGDTTSATATNPTNKNPGEGWFESADHKINESFQFKLLATIPASVDLNDYEEYEIVFNDVMSTGVTFESIASVKMKDAGDGAFATVEARNYTHSRNIYEDDAYIECEGDGSTPWTLTITDVKTAVDDLDFNKDITIEVIYNAHLNTDAQVLAESDSTTNENTSYITYSNNPNADTKGKSPEDHVWVFTYKIDNIKVDGANKKDVTSTVELDATLKEAIDAVGTGKTYTKDGKVYIKEDNKYYELPALADAGFTLKDSGNNDVNLIWDDSKGAYRPATAAEIAETGYSAEMKSQANGKFNIIGLDAGTYTLEETTVPAGYNKAQNITVTIGATHKENDDQNTATATLTNTNTNNTIVNNKGNQLPETGGVGTTLFYVFGSMLVIAAAVYFVTKKRSEVE